MELWTSITEMKESVHETTIAHTSINLACVMGKHFHIMTGVHPKTCERFYLGEHSMVRPKWKSKKFCGRDLLTKIKLVIKIYFIRKTLQRLRF